MAHSVSIIMPIHNGARFVKEALLSLLPGPQGMELIVVDDGSTDESLQIVESIMPSATILRQSQRGPAAARNAGIAAASGEFIAFIDADDIWPDGKLETQLHAIQADQACSLVVGNIRRFRGTPPYEFSDPYFLFLLGASLSRRELFQRIGPFDESMRHGFSDDTDWFLRAWESGAKIRFLPDVMLHYRVHQASLTAGMDCKSGGFLLALKMSLARRRRDAAAAPDLPEVDATEAIKACDVSGRER